MASRHARRRLRRGATKKRRSVRPALPVTPHAATHTHRHNPSDETAEFAEAGLPARSEAEADSSPRLGALMALLLGVTAGMLMLGFKKYFLSAKGAPSIEGNTVVGIMLIAVSAGVRVPQHLATWIGIAAWRRVVGRRGNPDKVAGVLVLRSIDRSLHWTVLAVIALACGLTSAATPLMIDVSLQCWTWTASHFIWSDVPRTVAEVMVTWLCALMPMGLLGLACTCTYRLLCRHGQWETRAGSYHLLGAALGLSVAYTLGLLQIPNTILLVASAVPALCVAAISAGVLAAAGARNLGNRGDESALGPTRGDRWPMLLRASVVIVAVAATTWVHGAAVGSAADGSTKLQRGALYIGCLGLGAWLGTLKQRSNADSIGGFGAACATAGAITAMVAIGLTNHQLAQPALLRLACILGIMSTGYAVASGTRALLTQVGSRSSVGTMTLARMLVAGGLSVAIIAPLSLSKLGFPATLAAVGLGLLALGGTLVIHEPRYSPTTRRIRIAAIFGAIGLMITLSLYQP